MRLLKTTSIFIFLFAIVHSHIFSQTVYSNFINTFSGVITLPGTLNNGLVSFHPFMGNAYDRSVNKRTTSITGTLRLIKDHFGQDYNAYYFNGDENNYLYLPHAPELNFDTSFSISLWIRFDSNEVFNATNLSNTAIQDNFFILGKGNYDSQSYSLYINHSNQDRITSLYRSPIRYSKPATKNNQGLDRMWHHIVTVNNTQTKKNDIYIDGAKAVSGTMFTFTGTFAMNMYPLVIGRHFVNDNGTGGSAFPFKGGIDDILIYKRALSENEILDLYNLSSSVTAYVTSVADFAEHDFRFYPNPSDGLIYVESNISSSDITVFDLLGNEVKSLKLTGYKGKIDLRSSLVPGIYFIKVKSGKRSRVYKIVIE